MSTVNVPYQQFQSIEEASTHVFDLLKKAIGLNTFFIASNDGEEVQVLKSLNRDYTLLEEGFNIDYQESF